jgi:putative copper export protein
MDELIVIARFCFLPRLLSKGVSAGGQRTHTVLSRSVIAEQIAGFLVLAIVALLGILSPMP